MQRRRRSRTKLKDRALPVYTKGEEIFNMVSHIVGGAIGVAALVLCIIVSAVHRNGYGLAGSIVYGISMIVLYTMSSVYHGLRAGTAKRVMQVLDHCTIYLLIAGTYTPILLSAMRPIDPVASWVLLGIVWGLSAIAITLTAIDLKKYAVFSMICYIGMGWCVILGIKPVMEVIPAPGLWLLVTGGIAYTVGAVLYGLGKRKRYMHSIFHLFCLIGSVLQAVCILLYAFS